MDTQKKAVLAWVGLFVNLFFLPGAGTILGGKTLIGIIQAALYIVLLVINIIYFGNMKIMMTVLIPALIIWVWAMITSIIIIKKLEIAK